MGSVTNLLTYSEDFTDSDWSKGDVSVTANATKNHLGDMVADKLVALASTADHYVSQSGVGNTFYLYVKAAENSFITLVALGVGNTNASFNLASGTVGTTLSNVSSTEIKNLNNGWLRVSVTWAVNITSVRIYPTKTNNGTTAHSLHKAQNHYLTSKHLMLLSLKHLLKRFALNMMLQQVRI